MEQNYKELRLCPGGAEATSTWKQTQPETFRYTFPIISDSPFHWLVLALEALWASQVALVVKNPPANAGDARDADSIPGLGGLPGGGNGTPLQYSCLENSMGIEPWATVHPVAKERDMTEHS